MTIRGKEWIIKQAKDANLLEPFCEECVTDKVVAFGVQRAGYVLRLSDEWHIINRESLNNVFDPHSIDRNMWRVLRKSAMDIFPRSFILGHSIERVKMPSDMVGSICLRPEYSQLGLLLMSPLLEPGYEGLIWFSFNNLSPSKIRVYSNEGIASLAFSEVDKE
jgi:deoxycytidine triphosphate deaminase